MLSKNLSFKNILSLVALSEFLINLGGHRIIAHHKEHVENLANRLLKILDKNFMTILPLYPIITTPQTILINPWVLQQISM